MNRPAMLVCGALLATLMGASGCTSTQPTVDPEPQPPTVDPLGRTVPGPVNVRFLFEDTTRSDLLKGIEVCSPMEAPPFENPDGGPPIQVRFHVTYKGENGGRVRFDCGNGTFGDPVDVRFGDGTTTDFIPSGCETPQGRKIMVSVEASG